MTTHRFILEPYKGIVPDIRVRPASVKGVFPDTLIRKSESASLIMSAGVTMNRSVATTLHPVSFSSKTPRKREVLWKKLLCVHTPNHKQL